LKRHTNTHKVWQLKKIFFIKPLIVLSIISNHFSQILFYFECSGTSTIYFIIYIFFSSSQVCVNWFTIQHISLLFLLFTYFILFYFLITVLCVGFNVYFLLFSLIFSLQPSMFHSQNSPAYQNIL
jgi:hypothetical protein